MSARKQPNRYPCTDAGNAELFAARYGARVRHDHRQGRWLIWDTRRQRWAEDTESKIRILAIRTARFRLRATADISDENKRKSEVRWAMDSEDRHKLDAALDIAKSLPPISDLGTEWDADAWLLGVANGVVDLRTGQKRTATQHDRLTKSSPVKFNSGAKCPRFERFLAEIFDGDPELIKYVQKAAGYSLTGSTGEQCLFACYGKGSNGKTTLLEIMLYIEGGYGVDLPFSVLEAKRYGSTPGEGVNLPGARFAKAVEMREGRRLDEARVKSWTGGDTVTIRPLYRNSFSFQPTHKLWLAFNHKPEIGDDSTAMWRRVRLIPFERTFDKQGADRELLEKLKAEAPGILNWAITGCLAWQKEGLKTPNAVENATSEYRAESDPLAPFFEECCDLDVAFQARKGELWNAYQDWCRANKERPASRRVFADKMKSRSFGEGSTGAVRFWKGLRLRAIDTTDTTGGCFQDSSIEQPSIQESRKEGQIASVASGARRDVSPSLARP
jgi:putative DNA primase/helicase